MIQHFITLSQLCKAHRIEYRAAVRKLSEYTRGHSRQADH